MYYPCSENKGADQLRGYREAVLRLCFRICKNSVFSWRGSFKMTLPQRAWLVIRIRKGYYFSNTSVIIPENNNPYKEIALNIAYFPLSRWNLSSEDQ